LKASASPFARARYIDDLCWANLNFSHTLCHQFVDEWFTIVCDNASRHTISINDVRSNEVDNILLLTSLNAIASAHLGK